MITVEQGQQTITLQGVGLNQITSVGLRPTQGVTLGALENFNSDNTRARLTINVDGNAPLGMRQLLLQTANGQLPNTANADRIRITKQPPEILSLNPVQISRGVNSLLLSILGRSLEGTQRITITPAIGMEIGAFTVQPDGQQVTTELTIDELVPLGPRLITVTTDDGDTSTIATAANTLTVINEPGRLVSPLHSPVITVARGDMESPRENVLVNRPLPLLSPHITVGRGGLITAIVPAQASIGAQFTLAITGVGLQADNDITLQPSDGVSLGQATVNLAGTVLSLPLSITQDAPQTLRTIQITRNGVLFDKVPFSATQFRVTDVLPTLASVSPNVIPIGAPATQLVVRGQFFANLQSLRLVPSNGVTIGAAGVNAEGTQITANITVAVGTPAGDRRVVVATVVGESDTTPGLNNTLLLTDQTITQVGPLLADGVTVTRATTEEPADITQTIFVDRQATVERLFQPPVPAPQNITLNAVDLTVGRGAFAANLSPAVVTTNSTPTLVITGGNLQQVTDVVVSPSQGITVNDPITVDEENSRLMIPLSIAPDAEATLRQVHLIGANGPVDFVSATDNRLRINNGAPEILSLSSIQALQGASLALTIRGVNLAATQAVTALPSVGLEFGAAVSNFAGTEITVMLRVTADAPLGTRSIILVMPNGVAIGMDTSTTNTFTIVEDITPDAGTAEQPPSPTGG